MMELIKTETFSDNVVTSTFRCDECGRNVEYTSSLTYDLLIKKVKCPKRHWNTAKIA